ncbi:CheR family methyltransferase [Fulvivirga aurantia]|uniref:CheR family methyltransferase n=1 Tax=Fulvivirga aurantia TaxID=2529383 RepID=UPI0012BCF30F|nr:protein-glutamate O-methyltransferase CheR [Fulvivirga aurantia]
MRETADIETRLLLEAIFHRYGYDFREYNVSSIKRRFEQHFKEDKLNSISEMIPKVLHDRTYFNELLFDMSVTVTEMFRDPELYRIVRERVVPTLQTYPFINLWNAGCATGEEAYSMAILLHEEGLLSRSQIYATDINMRSIEIAKRGIIPISRMKHYTDNYNKAGGTRSLSDYFLSQYNGAKINNALKKTITFSGHNLVMDGVFAEIHMIICKNVLIYFNKQLQNKVLKLLTESLCLNGFLCLGDKESLEFTEVRKYYEVVDKEAKIYQKKFPF